MFELPEPINARTRYCAVFGQPIKHSASPAMHNAAIASLKLNWRYVALEVFPTSLTHAIAGAKAMHFIGLNLTVPHKLLAVEMVDVLDESARIWGAVNTIRFEGREGQGTWRPLREWTEPPPEIRSHGFNTDADAIVRALTQDLKVELRGARVLLLGAGGAGQTAALKLASEGVSELWLVNRTRSRAEGLAQRIKESWPSVSVALGYPRGKVELVINATSLGLKKDDPLPYEGSFSLRNANAVYDMIYRPAETPLLKAAKQAGCGTANGLTMLLYQGAAALELWTGQPAPLQVMHEALKQNVYGA
ncbi:MAG TPA: shikimate dehydrogenase [Patescibacteria group bacterium]|nr:shikimate dehydrogenase [Patescibacteria group bacterium]